MSINLFIPAAGYGTRLRPLTNIAPKPLLPIAGIPLIQRVIENVSSYVEVDTIGINTHYLPSAVHSWLNDFSLKDKVQLFHEEVILGTGGALKNASDLTSKGTFLVANGDVLSDTDWGELLKVHKENNNLVTLAVQDREHERRVGTDKNLKLKIIDVEEKCSASGIGHWFGYACAAVYEPEFLDWLPEGESHVVPFWVEAANETGRVGVYDIGAGTYWFDLGTPGNFVQASQDCLLGEKRFFRRPLEIPWDCRLEGDVIVEDKVEIGSKVTLRDSILLPRAEILSGSHLVNCIAGPDFQLQLGWPQNSSKSTELQKIGNGGSDRVYTRAGDKVVLHYSAFEENVDRQIQITSAMRKSGVNVPEVYSHDPLKRIVELEDLGDVTLLDWATEQPAEEQEKMLIAVLDQLWKFQFVDEDDCPSIKDKLFDCSVLRWETSYFLERFIKRVCGIDRDCSSLNKDFQKLAEEVNALPKRIMHRDFQSENIMIHNSKPWFIDFQGAHWGPPFFDLVSLLRDPYIQYKCDTDKLAGDYLDKLSKHYGIGKEYCLRAVNLCGMQRHMQALGAYGFITHIRGKDFLHHCRPAFNLLKAEVETVADEFPVLNKLLLEAEERF
jgi:NDP-sugar pyrophosphorylase family protein